MKLYSVLILACAGLLLAGCGNSSSVSAPVETVASETVYPTNAQPKLPTIKLWLGAEELTAEIAATGIQVQTGMMFRTNIAENEGMIFILPSPRRAAFWMKNCVIPLSAAYIDPEGVILEIHDLQPGNTNSVVAASDNVQFVLETSRGWFERNNVSTGMLVRTERGTLRKTFFRQ